MSSLFWNSLRKSQKANREMWKNICYWNKLLYMSHWHIKAAAAVPPPPPATKNNNNKNGNGDSNSNISSQKKFFLLRWVSVKRNFAMFWETTFSSLFKIWEKWEILFLMMLPGSNSEECFSLSSICAHRSILIGFFF